MKTVKPTKTRKAISYSLVAVMLHASVAPALASSADKYHQDKQAQANSQANSKDDAVTQMIELAAKHELNVAFIKETEAKKRAGRNIFSRMVDGVIELFTDNDEEIALDDANDSTASQLLALETQAATEHAELIAELKQQKQSYQAKGFDAQSLQAQDELIAEMNSRYNTLTGLITKLKTAKNDNAKDNALAALNQQLTDWQPKKPTVDRKTLPWGTPSNEVRKPIVAEQSDINKVNAVMPTQAGIQRLDGASKTSLDTRLRGYDTTFANSAIGQWREAEYKIGNYLLNNQNPPQSPFNKGGGYFIHKSNAGALNGMTAAGNWPVLNALPNEVQPKDLAENTDVQITDEIKALATELDNSPANIYKWVHDNIEFVPTYGSMQGSALTLDTKRGNATDTASLLIALLRAAKVPARYVYGTVDVPANFAKDWVGGVNTLDAAQNLLGQGGVPNTAVMSGSQAQALRLEHVWVEAQVDYIGSRGALSADKTTNNMKQWIPLDASYKSHTRTQGIDLAKAVPFDAEKLIADAKQGATIDEKTGSVKNLNQAAINQAIEDYQAKVKTYLEQNHPKATVGEVLGTSQINEYKSDTLAPMLPYQVQTVISDYQELPENMRHYFVVKMFADAGLYGRIDYSSPALNVKIATPTLQGKPLALSFKPANEQEEQKLLSLLPKDENGTLPSSLPTSISMVPELTLGDEVIGSSTSTYKLGHDVQTQLGYQSPNTRSGLSDKTIVAGEYNAIGYNLQGMGQKQLEATKKTLEETKAKLENYQNTKDEAAIQGLTKHDLTGAITQAGVQSYFALNDVQDVIAQRQVNMIQYPHLTYGTFSNTLTTTYRFGLAFSTRPTGFGMDIDRILHIKTDKDNSREKQTAFNLARGPSYSANEHLVPEQLFDNPDTTEKEANGISAVKALQLAAKQGQTVYTITKENQAEVLPKLTAHSSETLADVRNSLNQDKVVQIHEKPITYFGWNGAGYTLLDKVTGAGAYMIDGGTNGGQTSLGQILYGLTFLIAGVAMITAALSILPLLVLGGAAGVFAFGALILSGFTLMLKGLATFSRDFAEGACKTLAAGAVFGSVGLGIGGGIVGGAIAQWINAVASVTTTFLGMFPAVQRWIASRVCGV